MSEYRGKNVRTINNPKAVRFETPDWVPCFVSVLPAAWIRDREALCEPPGA